ncbi:nucleotidyltransferase substrate binding protein [Christiangramia marina]|uniref:nucleotidyltransferase substrate binding protein n=1 Tax=Christiangramia marina TaxID=409436 RepID=UPI003AA81150
MSKPVDIRWEQRFSNFNKALDKLNHAVEYLEETYGGGDQPIVPAEIIEDDEFDLFQEGLIQRFEYTFELAWKVMQDYLKYQGVDIEGGPRSVIREAFSLKLFQDGKVWMEMIKSRNSTTHTYNEETANEIFHEVMYSYMKPFLEFRKKMEDLRSGKQNDIFEEE